MQRFNIVKAGIIKVQFEGIFLNGGKLILITPNFVVEFNKIILKLC